MSQNYRFTGKEHDAESGLENFEARYDASSIGRFMTPDDGSDQSVGDPQSWNLYAYVRNQPLRYVDPTGHGDQEATAAASSCAQDQGGGGHTTCNVDTSGTTAQNTAVATTMPIALDAPTITLPSAGEILSAVGTGLKAAGEATLDFVGEAATGALGVVAVVLTPTQTMRDEDFLKPIPASTSQQGAVDTSPAAAKEHTSGARPSTEERHEDGQARRGRDRGGERGDARREKGGKQIVPRTRPPGHKGPWPPPGASTY